MAQYPFKYIWHGLNETSRFVCHWDRGFVDKRKRQAQVHLLLCTSRDIQVVWKQRGIPVDCMRYRLRVFSAYFAVWNLESVSTVCQTLEAFGFAIPLI